MLNPNSPLSKLLNAPMRPGTVQWIGIRPSRGDPMVSLDRVALDTRHGVAGDRYEGRSGERQVTLIQSEDLHAIAAYLAQPVTPQQLRRNILTSGINLLALKDKRFRLGSALLEMTGECHPCSQMEATFGAGGYNAVRGHGGITARVLENGEVAIGDVVSVAT